MPLFTSVGLGLGLNKNLVLFISLVMRPVFCHDRTKYRHSHLFVSFKQYSETILTWQNKHCSSSGANSVRSRSAVDTKWLSTANRSRVSIRGRPCKIFLTSSLITMQKLAAVSHAVCAHVRRSQNLGDAGTHKKVRYSPHVLSYQISSN